MNIAAQRASRAPFIHASIGLHVFMAGTVTMQPSWWPMALATLIADHAVITGAGLWPTSTLLGPNLRRLPAAAIHSSRPSRSTTDPIPK